MKLAATDIRIEAPIPGKAAVGIEVPNKKLTGVNLRDVIDTDTFRKAAGGVPVCLGKNIAGNPIVADLTKMPHLLVAGSTGSGKSVCINTFIASILFKQRPEDVKIILIDPKVVELSNYNGIPHLLTPVVTDPRKPPVSCAGLSGKWTTATSASPSLIRGIFPGIMNSIRKMPCLSSSSSSTNWQTS